MFGIGFSEIIVMGLIAIIFIRPEDLPKFLRKMGKLYAQAKKAYNEVVSLKDDLLREIDLDLNFDEEIKSLNSTKVQDKVERISLDTQPPTELPSPSATENKPETEVLPESTALEDTASSEPIVGPSPANQAAPTSATNIDPLDDSYLYEGDFDPSSDT